MARVESGYMLGRTVARSRARLWPAWPLFWQCGGGHYCLVVLGGRKEVWRGIGCPGEPVGEERG